MAATARQEKEMKAKYNKIKDDPSKTPLERLRAYVMSRGCHSLKALNRAFKKMDERGDNRLHFGEFQTALRNTGLPADADEVRVCFDQMDMDGTGSLSIDEFITALRPPMTKHRLSLVSQAFGKLDKDGNGTVTTDDLHGVYVATKHPKYISGEFSEEDVFKEFLNSFNGPTNYTGEVTREDFDNYYAGVSASIDTDAYFDLMMRQAWKL